MFNEYMWQKFYLTGNIDDYLIYKESDEDENIESGTKTVLSPNA